jgi:hypothetical protein
MFKREHPEYYVQNNDIHSYSTTHKNKTAVMAHKANFLSTDYVTL